MLNHDNVYIPLHGFFDCNNESSRGFEFLQCNRMMGANITLHSPWLWVLRMQQDNDSGQVSPPPPPPPHLIPIMQ
jgi:hypothetical protein